jgi:dolichol-phosphate mannosyltransferase
MNIPRDGFNIQKLSIVIPVYNEQATINEVVKRVCAVDLGDIKKQVIISDDGSTDETPAVLEALRFDQAEIVQVYTSPINLGKGAAVRLGMKLATGEAIIIQDADLELNPEEYIHILEPLLNNQEKVVYGSRFLKPSQSIHVKTRLANKFLTLLTNILYGSHLTDMETAYKAFRSDIIKNIKLRCVSFDIEPEITAKLLRAGYHIHEVSISYNPRTVQEGKKINWMHGIEAIYTLFRCRFWE